MLTLIFDHYGACWFTLKLYIRSLEMQTNRNERERDKTKKKKGRRGRIAALSVVAQGSF